MSRATADASVFHAIADPTRRAILAELSLGDRTVGDLLRPFSCSQSALSQHLAVLRRAQLVAQRREGRFQLYSLTPEPLANVVDWVAHFDRFWDKRLASLQQYLDRKRR